MVADPSFVERIEAGQICVVRSRVAFLQLAVFYGFVAFLLFVPSWHPEVWWVWRVLSPIAGCGLIALIVVMWHAGWTISRDGIAIRNYVGHSVVTPWSDVEWVGYDRSGAATFGGLLALRTRAGRRIRTGALIYYSEKAAQPLIDNIEELRLRAVSRGAGEPT